MPTKKQTNSSIIRTLVIDIVFNEDGYYTKRVPKNKCMCLHVSDFIRSATIH